MALWKGGVVKQMPNLVNQECLSLALYLSLQFHLERCGRLHFFKQNADSISGTANNTAIEADTLSLSLLYPSAIEYRHTPPPTRGVLYDDTLALLDRFLVYTSESGRYQRELTSWSPVIVLVFREVLDMDWEGSRSTALSGSETNAETNLEHCLPLDRRFVHQMYQRAVRLLSCDTPLTNDRGNIRQAVVTFLDRVGSVFLLP
jgi:hypothetical protein